MESAGDDTNLHPAVQGSLMRIAAAVNRFGPMTMSELSRQTGLDKMRLSENVRVLAARGYLVARKDGFDLGATR